MKDEDIINFLIGSYATKSDILLGNEFEKIIKQKVEQYTNEIRRNTSQNKVIDAMPNNDKPMLSLRDVDEQIPIHCPDPSTALAFKYIKPMVTFDSDEEDAK